MTVIGGVAFHFILGAAVFEQLWFVEERGFDRSEIAELSGWLAFGGGILGNLFGGIGGDMFLRRTGMGRPMFLFWIYVGVDSSWPVLSSCRSNLHILYGGYFCWLFSVGLLLRTHVLNGTGVSAAADSRHSSSLLHSIAKLCWFRLGCKPVVVTLLTG